MFQAAAAGYSRPFFFWDVTQCR